MSFPPEVSLITAHDNVVTWTYPLHGVAERRHGQLGQRALVAVEQRTPAAQHLRQHLSQTPGTRHDTHNTIINDRES